MSAGCFENLDLACAKVGKDIAQNPSEELKKLLGEALGVLEEQGLYALFLFLQANNKKEAKQFIAKLDKFLRDNPQKEVL